MKAVKILVVDDEARMRKLISDFLKMKGYEVLEAGDGAEAVREFSEHPDTGLIILDVMMPVMNGWDTARSIRRSSDVPIIMLTARSEEQDELQGFSLGVDEYITKPFSPKILMARVEAVLRRAGKKEGAGAVTVGKLTLDRGAHTVTAAGEPVDLSYKEFELLDYFVSNKNIALSRENILNNVWDYDYFGDARTIDTHVKKLRAKLGDAGSQIKTIWGMGYKFEAE